MTWSTFSSQLLTWIAWADWFYNFFKLKEQTIDHCHIDFYYRFLIWNSSFSLTSWHKNMKWANTCVDNRKKLRALLEMGVVASIYLCSHQILFEFSHLFNISHAVLGITVKDYTRNLYILLRNERDKVAVNDSGFFSKCNDVWSLFRHGQWAAPQVSRWEARC